jgi:hypothetical protein
MNCGTRVSAELAQWNYGFVTANEEGPVVKRRRSLDTKVTCRSSPRLSQLDSCFVERGALQVNRLRRSPVIAMFPWNARFETKPEPKAAPKERRDPLKLARYYQSLLDSGKFESRAALARHLGVSRARVTQVLRQLRRLA